MSFEPIAVVGQSCILPGALDPMQLWQAVHEGQDLIRPAPAGRWRIAPELVRALDPRDIDDHTWTDRGGYVQGFEERFDPGSFGLPADEVATLDPLFHQVLAGVRDALCDAGRQTGDGHGLAGPRVGAIFGNLSYPSAALSRLAEAIWMARAEPAFLGGRAAEVLGLAAPDPRNRFMSGLPALLLARALGLGGTCFALDAACSSSLYAIKLACDCLHERRADLMVAGGVNRADDLFLHVGFTALQALSRTGQTRPFHRLADGLLPAEGAAFVALKRLGDALRQGERILGVIRAVGLENDGRGRGLLAPCPDGQERALRQAYAQCGLVPRDIGLVECHATGTPVGDLAEVQSMSRVFEGHPGLPVGSLKGNLGHLITASGAAGLIKVLGAMAHRRLPPTLHVEDPMPELHGSPLVPITEARDWEAPSPLRAAVNNFGFGGNNAHLIVEQWQPGAPVSVAVPARFPTPAVAIVGLGVLAADGKDMGDFASALFSGQSRVRKGSDGNLAGLCDEVELPLVGLRFPPRDLDETLAQQLLVLKAALCCADQVKTLPHERTAVFIGMQCDAEVGRYGARLRLPQWASTIARALGDPAVPPGWAEAARAGVSGLRRAAGVVGAMPNIPANRLNSQLDLRGPGFTVSAEEASGLVALDLARRALERGEIDAAFVGGVDLCCEPVATEAARRVLPEALHLPGDAAVVLVLKRQDEALRDSDRIYAILGDDEDGAVLALCPDGEEGLSLTPQFGHAHAASGLLHLAAAALACLHQASPGGLGSRPSPWWPSEAPRRTRISAGVMGPRRHRTVLVEPRAPAEPLFTGPAPLLHRFSGADRAEVLAALASGHEGGDGPARLVLVAHDPAERSALIARARGLLATGLFDEQPGTCKLGEGIYYREEPLRGELGLVFTGPAGVFPGMGRDLVLALPELHARLALRGGGQQPANAWIFEPGGEPGGPQDKLWGSSWLAQLHAEFTRGLLGLRPEAAIGFCSGETNALFALGAWQDLAGFYDDIVRLGVFSRQISGEFEVVRRFLDDKGHPFRPVPGDNWVNWRLLVPEAQVREALEHEPLCHLCIIASPGDLVIGGDTEACRRVVAAVGRGRAYPLGYDVALHGPVMASFRDGWRELHHRPTTPVPGVRFYTSAKCSAYEASADAAADALTGMAINRVDFPAVIQAAYRDGVRIFVEHGPRDGCTKWIRRILGSKEHLCVALDVGNRRSALDQAVHATAELLAAGVTLDDQGLNRRLQAGRRTSRLSEAGPTRRYPAHPAPMVLPPLNRPSVPPPAPLLTSPVAEASSADLAFEDMAPAPWLPPVSDLPDPGIRRTPENLENLHSIDKQPLDKKAKIAPLPETPVIHTTQPLSPIAQSGPPPPRRAPEPAPVRPLPRSRSALAREALLRSLEGHLARVSEGHRQFAKVQGQVHRQFLDQIRRSQAFLVREAPRLSQRGPDGLTPVTTVAQAPLAPMSPRPLAVPIIEADAVLAPDAPVGPAAPALCGVLPEAYATALASAFPGPTLDKAALLVHARGRISEIFGPLFRRQDDYAVQVRLPEPPLLLADRVLGISGEPGTLGKGIIWTETDIPEDAWYLHDGYMPAGIAVEAGQADLMLISYLGIDFLNQGERAYRLLGCDLSYHGSLPARGDTLRYAIEVTGHARVGDVRLFFFQYDCWVNGERRLSVRNGQAGFFTEAELRASGGVIWSAETSPPLPNGRLDPPPRRSTRTAFSRAQVRAFAEGRPLDCFGPGFELCLTHTRTPRIQGGKMQLIQEVTDFDPEGGPWGRGTLRVRNDCHPDDWWMNGHFHNDPCMPGTLMAEACLQCMAFYLAALGCTLRRDGWRFDPVPGENYHLVCRGQVIPTTRELVYEIFVEEFHDGPIPTLYADILATADGLKVFHGRRLGLRLVPDWPMTSLPRLPDSPAERGPVAVRDGFRFDYRSLLACAWGRPSEAFGAMALPFDGTRHIARLPGPPYHFMSRVTHIEGEMGSMKPGAWIDLEYDIPEDAWYFRENAVPLMPFCVLLEAVLQPCGWLAVYIGCPGASAVDVYFRNLDGTGVVKRDLDPHAGTLRTRTRLRSLSRMGPVILASFTVECRLGDELVYALDTGFGFFPKEALAHQVGLPKTDEQLAALAQPGTLFVNLRERPSRYMDGPLALPRPMLLMLDRVTGYWPEGGTAGLGRLRAEKDVDVSEWFFKAHFFQDPVWPGSLGLEAMIQLLQFYAIHEDLGRGFARPRFEPMALDCPFTWKYRGQVAPHRERVTVMMDILERKRDERGVLLIAESSLWVDGLRIYHTSNLPLRLVDDGPAAPSGSVGGQDPDLDRTGANPSSEGADPVGRGPVPRGVNETDEPEASNPGRAQDPAPQGLTVLLAVEKPSAHDGVGRGGVRVFAAGARDPQSDEVLDPETDRWLSDHRPNWTLPTLPLMSMLDRIAAAALSHEPHRVVAEVRDLRVSGWLIFDGPRRLRCLATPVPGEPGLYEGTLSVWREAHKEALSRFEPVCSGRVQLADTYAEPPPILEPLPDLVPMPDPYEAGMLFHGPAFQLLRSLSLGPGGSSAILDVRAGQVPRGLLHQALLDAAVHGIAHDALEQFAAEVPPRHIAYPYGVEQAHFFGPLPDRGLVRLETRWLGLLGERFARFHIQLLSSVESGEERPLLDLHLCEVLIPMGPHADNREARKAFRDGRFVPGAGLSRFERGTTRLTDAEVRSRDWLRGSVAHAYRATQSGEELTRELAVKDHVAQLAQVHPATVSVDRRAHAAVCEAQPLTCFPVSVRRDGTEVVVADAGPPRLDIKALRDFGERVTGLGPWAGRDFSLGLCERFVGRVVLEDPAAFRALYETPLLYLGNHQVQVESMLFPMLARLLGGLALTTVAKEEHRTAWIGPLSDFSTRYPGLSQPRPIVYFNQKDPASMFRVLDELREEVKQRRSVFVHVEGELGRSCRTPVQKLSSVFLDLSRELGLPIVPVRFARGLPVGPLDYSLDFPMGYGRQDYYIGRPILPETLLALPYAERRQHVLQALNTVGPPREDEQPCPGDPAFAERVRTLRMRPFTDEVRAVVLAILHDLRQPSDQSLLLLRAARTGRLTVPDDEVGRWLARVARWLLGPGAVEVRHPDGTLAG